MLEPLVERSGQIKDRVLLAQSLHHGARARLAGGSEAPEGHRRLAASHNERAAALLDGVLEEQPDHNHALVVLAGVCVARSEQAKVAGEFGVAATLFEKAIAGMKRTLEGVEESGSLRAPMMMASMYFELADIRLAGEDRRGAIAAFSEAVANYRSIPEERRSPGLRKALKGREAELERLRAEESVSK